MQLIILMQGGFEIYIFNIHWSRKIELCGVLKYAYVCVIKILRAYINEYIYIIMNLKAAN